MIVRELTFAEIDGMRRRGELECRCDDPIPLYLAAWNGWECERCRKIWYQR